MINWGEWEFGVREDKPNDAGIRLVILEAMKREKLEPGNRMSIVRETFPAGKEITSKEINKRFEEFRKSFKKGE